MNHITLGFVSINSVKIKKQIWKTIVSVRKKKNSNVYYERGLLLLPFCYPTCFVMHIELFVIIYSIWVLLIVFLFFVSIYIAKIAFLFYFVINKFKMNTTMTVAMIIAKILDYSYCYNSNEIYSLWKFNYCIFIKTFALDFVNWQKMRILQKKFYFNFYI